LIGRGVEEEEDEVSFKFPGQCTKARQGTKKRRCRYERTKRIWRREEKRVFLSPKGPLPRLVNYYVWD